MRAKAHAVADDLPNSAIEQLIDEWCHNSLYRDILKLRFIDGLTYEVIAEQVDMSPRQIKNIVYKEGDKVLKHFSAH